MCKNNKSITLNAQSYDSMECYYIAPINEEDFVKWSTREYDSTKETTLWKLVTKSEIPEILRTGEYTVEIYTNDKIRRKIETFKVNLKSFKKEEITYYRRNDPSYRSPYYTKEEIPNLY